MHSRWAGEKKSLSFPPNTTIKKMLENFKQATKVTGQGSGIMFPAGAQAKDKLGNVLASKATLQSIFLTAGNLAYVLPTEVPTLYVFGVVEDLPSRRSGSSASPSKRRKRG